MPMTPLHSHQGILSQSSLLAWAVGTLGLLFSLQEGLGQAMGYDAILADSTLPKGESTILQVRYTNCEPASVPELPEIDGLTIQYNGPSRSSKYSFINGRQTSLITLSHQFTITPQREGTFVIPPLESTIQGKDYRTKTLRLSVSKGRDYSQYAFIRVRVPKQSVFLGEVFQMAVELFELNAKLEEKPVIPTDGLVIAEAGKPTQSQSRIGNQLYNQITFRYSVRAVKTGELVIGPVSWKVPLYFRNQSGRRQRGAFDSLFRGLADLNSTVRRDVLLKSEPVNLLVKSLPDEGQPEGFNGAVGNFTMKLTASPTTLTAGDPITLVMALTGRGALESLKMPLFDDWHEFKQYPETSTIKHTDEMGLSGTKTFEKVVIPNNAEIASLPEIQFSFFDPLSQAYKTLSHPPIPLSVQPNLTAASAPTILAESGQSTSAPNIATNIVHIKPHQGTLASAAQPWLTQPWFLGVQTLPILVWISAILFRWRQTLEDRNPRAQRKKTVGKLVQSGLSELGQHAANHDSEAFFALLFRLLQEQIGERLDLPANAITEAVVETDLSGRILDQDLIESLEHLFQTCNQSRYAPSGKASELTEISEKAAVVLAEIQSLPD